MTPEKKAKELIEKFMYELMAITNIADRFPVAKSCALICVEEMIKIQEDFYGLVLTQPFRDRCIERVEYLEQVKQFLKQ